MFRYTVLFRFSITGVFVEQHSPLELSEVIEMIDAGIFTVTSSNSLWPPEEFKCG